MSDAMAAYFGADMQLQQARVRISRITPENIPEYLRNHPRWTIFSITGEVDSETGKLEKKILHSDGSQIPKGESIRKGHFSDVMQVVKSDKRFIPAFWIEKGDNLLFIDIDDPRPDRWLKLNSFTEISISGGCHILCWYQGKDLPNHANGYELYQGGRWIALTGDIVDNKRDINDLTSEITKLFEVKLVGTLTPFTVPVKATPGNRHNTFKKMVASMTAKGYSFPAILAACHEENKATCSPPKDPEAITKEVTSLHAWAIEKEAQKQAKTAGKGAEEPGKKPYNYNDMAGELRTTYNILSFNKTLYRYQDGIYIEDNGFLDSQITRELLERGIAGQDRVTTAAQQVRHYLTFGKIEPEYPFNIYPDAIPLKNGILKIDFKAGTTTLIPFSPEYRFNYRLNVSYDAAAEGTPIKNYLESLGVDTAILMQIPAHAILGMLGRVYKKAYFVKGCKNSGKSTFIDLIVRHLFGITVCSSISLQSVIFDKFRLAELDGKIVNAYADLSDQKIRDIGIFKALTGGDLVTVERKHRDPYQMRNKALFLFSANKYPKIDAGDDAFWDRWIALEFSGVFSVDTTFEDKTFTDENLSGFLNLVLTRMQDIIKNGKIKDTDSVEQKWLNDSSSCHRFINDELVESPGAILIKSNVYARYVEYCHAGDYEVEAPRTLTDAMSKQGALSPYPTVKGRREHCYQGFTTKEAKENNSIQYPDVQHVQGERKKIQAELPHDATVQDVQD